MNAEAGLYLPFPREDADVDYQKIGFFVDDDGVEKVQVVLVATRREVTDTYIETFKEAGLNYRRTRSNQFCPNPHPQRPTATIFLPRSSSSHRHRI